MRQTIGRGRADDRADAVRPAGLCPRRARSRRPRAERRRGAARRARKSRRRRRCGCPDAPGAGEPRPPAGRGGRPARGRAETTVYVVADDRPRWPRCGTPCRRPRSRLLRSALLGVSMPGYTGQPVEVEATAVISRPPPPGYAGFAGEPSRPACDRAACPPSCHGCDVSPGRCRRRAARGFDPLAANRCSSDRWLDSLQDGRRRARRPRRPRAQPQGHHRPAAAERADLHHRALRLREVVASPSTRSTRRASGATSSRSRPTRASSCR